MSWLIVYLTSPLRGFPWNSVMALGLKNTIHYQNVKQEAQLMLTNLRDAFEGHSRSLRVISFDRLCMALSVFFSNFVHKMHRFWDIRLQKCRDFENWVRGPSRSLEISPFDRACMTSYWRSIITMALSRVISEIFNVIKCDLEIWVKGHSRSLKVVPLDRLCMVSY